VLVISVHTDEYLRAFIQAARSCGYAGLMVILARTADSRNQHEELTRDWTSLHDVTGPLIGVLCPDPDEMIHNSAVGGGPYERAVGTPGLRVEHPSWEDERRFGEYFWRDSGPFRAAQLDRYARSRPSQTLDAHHSAWTEAVSHCASYFGIAEAHLPSLLFLSVWDRTALLINIPAHLSLYVLTKRLVAGLGDGPRLIRDSIQSIDDLEQGLRSARRRQIEQLERINSRYRKWHNKIVEFDRMLQASQQYFQDDLIEQCSSSLHELLRTGNKGDLPNLLRKLHSTASGSEPLRHSTIWGLLTTLESPPGPPTRIKIDPNPNAEIKRLETRLADAHAKERAYRDQLHLADALEQQLQDILGGIDVTNSTGTRGLTGWTIRLISSRRHGSNIPTSRERM